MIKVNRWGIISVPKVGIEPTFLSEHDFESCASAYSATSAGVRQYTTPSTKVKMKLGIIGLPQSGKTTLFNALTRGNTPTHASAGRMEVHNGVVDVPDPRVGILSAMFKPRKTIYAKVTYADIAGLEGSATKTGISGTLLNTLTQMDAFIHVVRCFEDGNVPHPSGSINPARDLDAMLNELLLNDLVAVERKLERLTDERRKGGTDKTLNERQTALFNRLNEALSGNKPLRFVEFNAEEKLELASYGLLTRKPVLTVFNLGEGQPAPEIKTDHPTVALPAKLEAEIALLPPEDAQLVHAGIRHHRTCSQPHDPPVLRPAQRAVVLHRRRGRSARLDDPPRRDGAGIGGRDPHRPGARIRSGGGGPLR